MDYVALAADIVTIVGLISIGFLVVQMRSDRLAASAGAVATIHENIRTCVDRLSQIDPRTEDGEESAEWNAAFRDLLNELELACALHLDSQLTGRTGRLAEFLVRDMLRMLNSDPHLQAKIEEAIHDPETFVNIRDFRAKGR